MRYWSPPSSRCLQWCAWNVSEAIVLTAMIIVFGTREYSERAIMQLPSILQRQLCTDCYHDNGRWGVYVYSEFPTKRFWWLEGECDSELGGFWDGELCVSNHHQSRRTFSMAPAFSDSNFESSAKNTWFNWLKKYDTILVQKLPSTSPLSSCISFSVFWIACLRNLHNEGFCDISIQRWNLSRKKCEATVSKIETHPAAVAAI